MYKSIEYCELHTSAIQFNMNGSLLSILQAPLKKKKKRKIQATLHLNLKNRGWKFVVVTMINRILQNVDYREIIIYEPPSGCAFENLVGGRTAI